MLFNDLSLKVLSLTVIHKTAVIHDVAIHSERIGFAAQFNNPVTTHFEHSYN